VELPFVRIGPDEHRVVGEVSAALATDPDVFSRGGELVRLRGDLIETVPQADLRTRITGLVRLVQTTSDRRGKARTCPAHPPKWLTPAVEALGRWPGVRELAGVVVHPVLRPDGSLLTAAGYDPGTGLYLTADVPVRVPESPTAEDARAAVAELCEVVCDFQFATNADRAAWLAALLTPLARPMFDGPVPWMIATATTPAAGKGLSLKVVGVLLTGSPMPVSPWADNDEELRKAITTAAAAGRSMHLFDNLTGAVGNGVIDAALTTTHWCDRLLGGNRMFDGPLRTVFYGTGNNMDLRGDTPRRVLLIRLATDMECPEERTGFTHPDLIGYVRSNRARLLSAALTVLRGWVAAGRPAAGLRPWGSYEAWSGVVREALVWAGQTDPLHARPSGADSSLAADMAAILTGIENIAVRNRDGSCGSVLVRQIVEQLRPDAQQYTPGPRGAWLDDLEAALTNQCPRIDPVRVGWLFRRMAGRNFGGHRLVRAGEAHSGLRWTVEAVPAAVGGPENSQGPAVAPSPPAGQ
jgi:hypothetical protein